MIEINPLVTDDDWHRWRGPLEALESRSAPNPWATWDYVHAVWRTFHATSRCWLMSMGENKSLTGAVVWRETTAARRGIRLRVLRSLDDMVLRIPAVVTVAGDEQATGDALAAGLGELRRLAGADIVTLYRLDKGAAAMWAQALRLRGVTARERLFTVSPRLELSDDLEQFEKTIHQSELREIQRRERKLAREKGEVRLQTVTGRPWDDPDLQAAWHEFEALRTKTWQHEWGEQSGRVDNALLTGFYRNVAEGWAKRGWLELALLSVGETAVAFGVNLHVAGRMWMYLMGYDQEYRAWGAGNVLFLKELVAVHARGGRTIEFGGEALDWKHKWTNVEDELVALEWPLGGWKGRVWALAARLSRGKDTDPMRSAADNVL